ncbi:MAG: nucleotidyl transferase AbiEii/AbiGii toxin family protein [Candidatus Cloacimonadota bacterium]|nr:nucleotidyl transferase AbiEii/AbiGii toxin family protein [Candidatus Cloacimonadota bacterium]
MDRNFYFNKLYPLQDNFLSVIQKIDQKFYLTGRTVASRVYLHHRFSDDLDFFVNDKPEFKLWVDRILDAVAKNKEWHLDISLRENRFARCLIVERGIELKIEFVNDVPSHIGLIRNHPILGRIDSPENILANRVTAIVDRNEPKDVVDVWAFCTKMGLSLSEALKNAGSKAAGIFSLDVARILYLAENHDFSTIKWIKIPDFGILIQDIKKIVDKLIEITE